MEDLIHLFIYYTCVQNDVIMFVVGHTKKINQNELGHQYEGIILEVRQLLQKIKKNGIYHPNFENVKNKVYKKT